MSNLRRFNFISTTPRSSKTANLVRPSETATMRMPLTGKVKAAMILMRWWERRPSDAIFEDMQRPMEAGEHLFQDAIHEVFDHPAFQQASASRRQEIMSRVSEMAFHSEVTYPWEHYFSETIASHITGKVLDVGSFVGGRTIAWAERYQLDRIHGLDIREIYAASAQAIAESRHVDGRFSVGRAENMPYDNDSFDTLLSFNTFEHVQDARRVLHECHRVLRPGGKLLVTFPGFYQPLAHHLDMVTIFPCIHWLFSRDTLLVAYNRIIEERGPAANWYRRTQPLAESWEAGNRINGTTARDFRCWIAQAGWSQIGWSVKPVGTIGRAAPDSRLLRTLLSALRPLARLPLLEEGLLHRVSCIMQKT